MDKILSIVIPTYNMEKYLHYALSSLQTDRNMELLDVMVINDGSKDSSLSIAREFESKYPDTFRVIDKENGNYGSCINRGVKEAMGKYIKVLDADDSYDTEALSALVDRLLSVDADLILTDYIVVNEERIPTDKHTRPYLPTDIIMDADYLWTTIGKACTDDVRGNVVEMHEIVYRTENLRRINYHQTEGIAFTDREWALIPMTEVKTAVYYRLPVYHYLVGRAGQTVDSSRAASLRSQGNKTLFVQTDFFNNCTNVSDVFRKYMMDHLALDLKYAYRTYLVTSYKSFHGNEAKLFDEELKSLSPYLYDRVALERVHPRIPLYFIKAWRDNGFGATPAIRFYRTFVFPLLRSLNLG